MEYQKTPTTPVGTNITQASYSMEQYIPFLVEGQVINVPRQWVQSSERLKYLMKTATSYPIAEIPEMKVFDFVLVLGMIAFDKIPNVNQRDIRPIGFPDQVCLCGYYGIESPTIDEDNTEVENFKRFLKYYLGENALYIRTLYPDYQPFKYKEDEPVIDDDEEKGAEDDDCKMEDV